MRRTKEAKPVVMACDPSFTAWGYALIQDDLVIDHGCLKTKPEAKKRRIREGDDRVRRTAELCRELIKLIEKYNVALIVSELPHGSQNAKAAVMIGIVVGVLVAISSALGTPVEWYSENDAKKALLGRISASKSEVMQAIYDEYNVKYKAVKYYDEAVADAIAIYHVAKHNSIILKVLNR